MDKQTILKRAEDYIFLEKDTRFREEVERLVAEGDIDALNDRFYTDLEFGTGGLRGIIGGGYNRMNPFVVKRATQGLANYIKKTAPAESASVVIAYDSRLHSDTFAEEAAGVLTGNNIRVYLFGRLKPTPELSFAVRYFKAAAGIVITASHNPPEYNGYKVVWNDGAQILPPHDEGIIEEVKAVTNDITVLDKKEAIDRGLLIMIDRDVDKAFIKTVKDLSLRPQLVRERGKELKVVYTPLCGTGAVPVSRALSELGIDVIFVPDQKDPDSNFNGLKYPNPEEASALEKAVALGRKVKADIVMGTDPDADRLGIAVPEKNGRFNLLTGNQLGALLVDYIFMSLKEMGKLPPRCAMVKTIVTSELGRLVAEDYGAICFDTLTGFKYIGEKIREFESNHDGPQFVMGYEESYGYLIGTNVRDKDAVTAATLACEMALYHLSKNISVLDRLNQLYHKYGYFEESLISKYFKGESGIKTMQLLMDKLRNEAPEKIGGENVKLVKDYKTGTTRYMETGEKVKDISLPSSNVLQFFLADDSIISVRPSGTEPKIKFYTSVRSDAGLDLEKAKTIVGEKTEKISEEINNLIDSI
ncbi:MAG: phospho-sugar mutase [Spirochaetales bacterium]|nr:phospho-sugar mutase [Spirochaetales bacterium]